MIIFPAIDIKNGECVRLYQGAMETAEKVAEHPLETALAFRKAGAAWIHMVDLDGAVSGKRVNSAIFLEIAEKSGLNVELGGGIRTMEDIRFYLENGIARVVLGSVALKNPALVKEACALYGERIAVGIDARGGKVTTEGWVDKSDVDYITLAQEMVKSGVRCIIFTDIDRDGMLSGPNLAQLAALADAVDCRVIASGGITDLKDIKALQELGLYGAICGRSIYAGSLKLEEAIFQAKQTEGPDALFQKADLIPAVIQDAASGQVLMLAYMNRESLEKTLESGYTWFYSRSRSCLWNKGASSGHLQKVLSIHADCDRDTLLIQVEQTGSACHTDRKSCFFNPVRKGEWV